MARDYTAEEIDFIKANVGSKTLDYIAEQLGRSRDGIITKMERIGIGSVSQHRGLLTTGCLAREVGVTVSTVRNWIFKMGLRAQKRKVRTSKEFLYIRTEDFWEWAYNHQEKVKVYRIPENTLAPEPDWVSEARRKGGSTPKKHTEDWTLSKERTIVRFILEGKDFKEIGRELNRSEAAVEKRWSLLRSQKEKMVRKEIHRFCLKNPDVREVEFKEHKPLVVRREKEVSYSLKSVGKMLRLSYSGVRNVMRIKGLPTRKVHLNDAQFRLEVDVDAYWQWARERKNELSSVYFQQGVMEPRPHWADSVQQEILERPWSKYEENKIKGLDEGKCLHALAKEMDRMEDSIKERLLILGEKKERRKWGHKEERQLIYKRLQGLTYDEIAEDLSFGPSTIYRKWKRISNEHPEKIAQVLGEVFEPQFRLQTLKEKPRLFDVFAA